jgi:hypothetical protein
MWADMPPKLIPARAAKRETVQTVLAAEEAKLAEIRSQRAATKSSSGKTFSGTI